MLTALTGVGLATAAGLNAYLPLLIFSLIAKFSGFIELPNNLIWMENWIFIAIVFILLVTEMILDKVPGVDNVNDLIQSIFRPLVGGLLFSAYAASHVDSIGDFWYHNPLIGALVGAVMGLSVHIAKAAARPAINASTGGSGAPIASFAEDGLAMGLTFIAFFFPLLVILVVAALAITVYRIVTTGRRRRRRRIERALEERHARSLRDSVDGWKSRLKALVGSTDSESKSPTKK